MRGLSLKNGRALEPSYKKKRTLLILREGEKKGKKDTQHTADQKAESSLRLGDERHRRRRNGQDAIKISQN